MFFNKLGFDNIDEDDTIKNGEDDTAMAATINRWQNLQMTPEDKTKAKKKMNLDLVKS